jgi:sulfotransferase
VFPHLEEVGADAVRALPAPRLIKTHLPFERTPWHADARYIFVARNPFDCAVSFYHHTRGFVRHYDFADGTFDEFFECFIRGEVDFGDYFDHLASWLPHVHEPNVFFVTYEAMLAGASAAVAAVGAFLGGAAAATAADPALVSRIVAASSFDSMSRDQRRWSSERPANMPEFVRKGVVGDWTQQFSREQARRLAEKFDERTRGTGAQDLWPDVLATARG